MSQDAAPDRPRSRTERFQLVMELFEALVGLSAEERVRRLAALRPGEAEVRRELEAMLAADERASTPMTVGGGLEALMRIGSSGAVEGGEAGEAAAPLPVLRGQYRILRCIGEGGMGVVYEAEQSLPRRNVALKAIRAGFSSRQVLRRFEREAHILGRLHHPGIAQVYEAGISESERGDQAFIAMELVEGAPLGEWARGRAVREKVELVARVCDAVQHAHQRRVIHRDLKPANVLVDRAGQPKILDFGVARLADDEDPGALRTREGQLLGTLPYMSPEQAGSDPDGVDARADVYSLGVVLYELLAGRLPHPPEGRTLTEMAMAIQGEEPPRLGRLDKRLRGDLESIASKALHKDRERRYQSALELGEDLRHWLAGAPIRARGDSPFYVLCRQIRRHRWVATASGLALVSLIAFAVLASISQRRADRDARELALALRTSNVELGRAMALSGNVTGAEKLVWDAFLERPDEHARWALWEVYSRWPCLRSFAGHQDSVIAMHMSADGELLATGSHDRTVRIWDWSGGTSLSERSFQNLIVGLAFTPDGRAVVGADWGGALTCWDPRSGAEHWRAEKPVIAPLVQMAVAAARPVAAFIGETAECALVDLETGEVARRLEATGARILSVGIDREAAQVAVGDHDGSVRLLDAGTGTQLWRSGEHAAGVASLSFLPCGGRLASGDLDGIVLVHSLDDGRVLERFESEIGSVRAIAFTPSCSQMLFCCAGGVALWERAGSAGFPQRPRFQQAGYAGTFAPDGKQLVTGSIGGGIRLWELEPEPLARTLPVGLVRRATVGMGPSADLVGRDAGEGVLEVVALDGEVVASLQVELPAISQIAFDTVGTYVAALSKPRHFAAWRLADGARMFERELPADAVVIRFAPDGGVLAAVLGDATTRLYDTASGAERAVLVHLESRGERIAFSHDGRRLASTHRGRRVELWDLERGVLDRAIESPRAVLSPAFDPTAEHLYVGTWDGRVLLFECATGRLLRTLEGHSQLVLNLAARRDGRFAVSSGSDGQIRLWNRDASVCLTVLDARAGGVVTFGLSADETRLRAIYWDGSLREWDLARFDSHIAGNLDYQRSLRSPTAGAAR